MRKSLAIAIAVEALVLLVAFALSVACIAFGVGQRHIIMNLVAILVLVLISGVMLIVYWWRSMQRDEVVRRFFVSPEWIYNHEIGYAPLRKVAPGSDPYGFVAFAADALAKMSYGLDVADTPEDFRPQLLIDSRVFHFHFIGDADSGEADDTVVVDRWSGAVQRIDRDEKGNQHYVELGKFANARDLAHLLMEYGAFDLDVDMSREGS